MAGGLFVLGIVAIALLAILAPVLVSASAADDREDALLVEQEAAVRAVLYDHQVDSACGVGHTTGRDSRLSSPMRAVGAIPPVGGVPEVARIPSPSPLVAFVHRHGLVGLVEQVAVASDDDLRAAAAATYGRSGLAAELHETVMEELASRVTFELARTGVRRG